MGALKRAPAVAAGWLNTSWQKIKKRLEAEISKIGSGLTLKSAVAAPMPREPPVTNAMWPCRGSLASPISYV
jgi:hypothetical protein